MLVFNVTPSAEGHVQVHVHVSAGTAEQDMAWARGPWLPINLGLCQPYGTTAASACGEVVAEHHCVRVLDPGPIVKHPMCTAQ